MKTNRRTEWIGIVATGCIWLSGCLVIPTDAYQRGSRRNLDNQSADRLQPGRTTLEEVLLTLGEPDVISEDGQRLGYAWSKVKAVWIVVTIGGAAGGEVERSQLLEISFDADRRVQKTRLVKEWGTQVTPRPGLEPTQ